MAKLVHGLNQSLDGYVDDPCQLDGGQESHGPASTMTASTERTIADFADMSERVTKKERKKEPR
jgi:hypothetical protein